MGLSYCISWINNRFETHTGPELWFNGDFEQNFTEDTVIPDPRPKTFEEAQNLATRMNNSPEFHNTTHKVVIYKRKKRADKPAPRGATERFTPVYLLPSAKAGRPRVDA